MEIVKFSITLISILQSCRRYLKKKVLEKCCNVELCSSEVKIIQNLFRMGSEEKMINVAQIWMDCFSQLGYHVCDILPPIFTIINTAPNQTQKSFNI